VNVNRGLILVALVVLATVVVAVFVTRGGSDTDPASATTCEELVSRSAKVVRKVVTDLGPASSMALIQTSGEHNVEVTDDPSRLMDAIDKFQGRRPYRRPISACDPQFIPIGEDGTPAGTGCDQMEFGQDLMFYQALQNAGKILGGNDRRRKAFVLVSENLAKDLSGLFQVGLPPGTPIDASSAYTSDQFATALASIPTQPANQHDNALLDMMEALRKGDVAVYSIDPRGEVTSQKLMEECSPVWGGVDDACLGGNSLPDWYAWPRQAQHGLARSAITRER